MASRGGVGARCSFQPLSAPYEEEARRRLSSCEGYRLSQSIGSRSPKLEEA